MEETIFHAVNPFLVFLGFSIYASASIFVVYRNGLGALLSSIMVVFLLLAALFCYDAVLENSYKIVPDDIIDNYIISVLSVFSRGVAEEIFRVTLLYLVIIKILKMGYRKPVLSSVLIIAFIENLRFTEIVYVSFVKIRHVTSSLTIEYETISPAVFLIEGVPGYAFFGIFMLFAKVFYHGIFSFIGIHALLSKKYWALALIAFVHGFANAVGASLEQSAIDLEYVLPAQALFFLALFVVMYFLQRHFAPSWFSLRYLLRGE
jgi:uncharacterized membrane protein